MHVSNFSKIKQPVSFNLAYLKMTCMCQNISDPSHTFAGCSELKHNSVTFIKWVKNYSETLEEVVTQPKIEFESTWELELLQARASSALQNPGSAAH